MPLWVWINPSSTVIEPGPTCFQPSRFLPLKSWIQPSCAARGRAKSRANASRESRFKMKPPERSVGTKVNCPQRRMMPDGGDVCKSVIGGRHNGMFSTFSCEYVSLAWPVVPPHLPNLLLHASFVFIDLDKNCSYPIHSIDSYSYPCQRQGLRWQI